MARNLKRLLVTVLLIGVCVVHPSSVSANECPNRFERGILMTSNLEKSGPLLKNALAENGKISARTFFENLHEIFAQRCGWEVNSAKFVAAMVRQNANVIEAGWITASDLKIGMTIPTRRATRNASVRGETDQRAEPKPPSTAWTQSGRMFGN